jgi:hypothetical protein
MSEETLTEKRQRIEREEKEARDIRRKQPRKPEEAPAPKGTGTFQVMPHRNRNPKDPTLGGKYRAKQGQRVQSFTPHPGEAVKFSDQE